MPRFTWFEGLASKQANGSAKKNLNTDIETLTKVKKSKKRLKLKNKKILESTDKLDFHPGSKDYFYKPDLFNKGAIESQEYDLSKVKKHEESKVDSTHYTNQEMLQSKQAALQKKNLQQLIDYHEEGKFKN